MRLRRRRFALVLAAATVGCGGDFAAAPDRPGVPGSAVAVGVTPVPEAADYFSAYRGLDRRSRIVVRNAGRWEQLWTTVTADVSPAPPLPAVDFSRRIVIVVAMGERPADSGYDTAIDGVYEADGRLYVVVREVTPGARCGISQAATHPVAVVLAPRVDTYVNFVERAEVRDCG
jgi:hypothetical protein